LAARRIAFSSIADSRATVRLANDTRVHHAVDLHVVNENTLPENLRRQVEAGAVRANGLEIADRLSRNGAGCLDCKVDGAGKRPVVLSGRFAVAIDAAVANGEFAGLAGEHFRRRIEKQCANFGERLPQRHAAKLNRLAAGGIALVRGFFRIARADRDALHRDIEFVGRNLRHRGEHALSEFDAPGQYGHFAR